MTAAQQALLDKAMTHLAVHGIGGLSLRELAGAIGTSHRMLIYHFGSREGLIAAIVEAMETQQRETLQRLGGEAHSPRDLIAAQWQQLSDPALRPFVVLFFEVLALALQNRPGTERFLENLTTPWLNLAGAIADDLGLKRSSTDLLLGIAVVRGLLLEAVASNDYASSTTALDRFLDIWDGQVNS